MRKQIKRARPIPLSCPGQRAEGDARIGGGIARILDPSHRTCRDPFPKARLMPSMIRKGDCNDDAAVEAFWSTLKHEPVYRADFPIHNKASLQIFDSTARFHAALRLPRSIGYLSPAKFGAAF